MIHETALRILEEIGIKCATQSHAKIVIEAGGQMTEDQRLLIPVDLVLNTLKVAGRGIKLFGLVPFAEI